MISMKLPRIAACLFLSSIAPFTALVKLSGVLAILAYSLCLCLVWAGTILLIVDEVRASRRQVS